MVREISTVRGHDPERSGNLSKILSPHCLAVILQYRQIGESVVFVRITEQVYRQYQVGAIGIVENAIDGKAQRAFYDGPLARAPRISLTATGLSSIRWVAL